MIDRRKFLRCFTALPALPVAIVAGKALAGIPAPAPVGFSAARALERYIEKLANLQLYKGGRTLCTGTQSMIDLFCEPNEILNDMPREEDDG